MARKNTYKGITFADNYSGTFAEFKKEFGSTHVFKTMVPSKREVALKEAYKVALRKPAAEDVEVKAEDVTTEAAATKTAKAEDKKPEGK